MNSIEFQVVGFVRQNIQIVHKDYDLPDIVMGLREGELETTITHEGMDTISKTITNVDGLIVARIISQETLAGTEFSGFTESVSDEDFDDSVDTFLDEQD